MDYSFDSFRNFLYILFFSAGFHAMSYVKFIEGVCVPN